MGLLHSLQESTELSIPKNAGKELLLDQMQLYGNPEIQIYKQ